MGKDIPKLEIKSIKDMFKVKKMVLREFGSIGLEIFEAIDGKRNVDQIAEYVNVDTEIVKELLDYLKTKGYLTVGQSQGKKKRPTKKSVSKMTAPKEEEPPAESAPEESAVEEPPAHEEPEEEQPPVEVAPERKVINEQEEKESSEEEPTPPEQAPEEGLSPEEQPEAEEEKPPEERPSEKKEPAGDTGKEVPVELLSLYPVINTDKLGEPGYVESRLFDKFGLTGIKVFAEINGLSTGEEIAQKTGIDGAKVAEILNYLKELDVISLFQFPKQIVESETSFEPIEGTPDEVKSVPVCNAQGLKDILPVDLPIKVSKSPLDLIKAKGAAAIKFGPQAMQVLDLVDGKKDIIQLAIQLNIPVKRLVDILAFFGSQKVMGFRPLSRDEITQRYGDDGLKIYKKFGRDGLLIYELLEKDMSIKDMVKFAGLDPKRGVEIIKFINDLLGIDLPIDEDIITKELGVKPK